MAEDAAACDARVSTMSILFSVQEKSGYLLLYPAQDREQGGVLVILFGF